MKLSRRKLLFVLGAGAAAIVAVALALLAHKPEQRPVQVGDPAPAFTGTAVRGGEVSLTHLRGHVVLLSFLDLRADTTENEPSRAQVVFLRSMQTQHARFGLRVVLVDAAEPAAAGTQSRNELVNDAYDWNLDPAIAILENMGAVVLIANTRTAKGTEEVFGSADMPAGALYAPISFVQKNPNTVQALTNAMVRALLWLQKATPEQVVATVPPEYLLGNKDAYLSSYIRLKDAFSPDGSFTEAGAQNTLKYLAAFNPAIKPADIKLGPTFDNSYVQKALAKYKK